MQVKKWLHSLLGALVLTLALAFPLQAANDIQGHWAGVPIEVAEEANLVAGYPDGSFKPDATISRGEFVAIGNRLFKPETDVLSQSQYGDIEGHWAMNEILIAEDAQILDALAGEAFFPDKAIERQEVAALLDAYLGTNKEEAKVSVLKGYGDQGLIRPGFESPMASLVQQGLLSGYPDGSLGPDRPITRAEAVALFLRATDQEPAIAQVDRLVVAHIDGKAVLQDGVNEAIYRPVQMTEDYVTAGNKAYILAPDGSLAQGLVSGEQATYLAEGEQGLAQGWRAVGEANYYFQPYDYAMVKDGPRATHPGVFLFDAEGKVTSGNYFTGSPGKNIYFAPPTPEEMTNAWLEGPDADRIAKGQAIVNYAAARQGIPFKWYGTDLNDPSSVYCCGVAYSAYKEFGIFMPGPNDMNMYEDRGYAMVRDQYLRVEEFGGKRIPQDFTTMWPGDISYTGSATVPYAHAALFMGHNDGRPIIAHAGLANGYLIEPFSIIPNVWGYHNLDAIRYV